MDVIIQCFTESVPHYSEVALIMKKKSEISVEIIVAAVPSQQILQTTSYSLLWELDAKE